MTAVDDIDAAPTLLGDAPFAGLEPGAALAVAVDGVDPADSSDDALLDLVLAFQRLVAWATAGAAAAAAELADRPVMNPWWPAVAGPVAVPDVAAEELALALGWSRRAAGRLVRDGRAYRSALTPTGDALAVGALSPVKARVLVDALESVPVELALDVQDAVLPGAPSRTPAQLSRDVARALLVADPAGSRERHDRACRGRRLDRPRILPDGMAGVWAVLPAQDAVLLDSTIDAVSRAGREAGDPRTLDQLRADTLVSLVVGTPPGHVGLVVGAAPAPTGTDADVEHGAGRARSAPRWPARTSIEVRVPLSSLLGLDDQPGELAGYGPISAEASRAFARGGTWRRVVTDPLSGAVLDVGRTRYRPPEDLADHVRVRDGTCVRPGCSTRARSCDLDHTVPFGRPGEVRASDVGEVEASAAGEDAARPGPVEGTASPDDPSPASRVRHPDDPAAGRTAADNLGPMCRRDHLVKTHGGFSVRQISPGTFEWRTPLGRTYTVTPGLDGTRRGPAPPF